MRYTDAHGQDTDARDHHGQPCSVTGIAEDQCDEGYSANGWAYPRDGLAQHREAAQHLGPQPQVIDAGRLPDADGLVCHVSPLSAESTSANVPAVRRAAQWHSALLGQCRVLLKSISQTLTVAEVGSQCPGSVAARACGSNASETTPRGADAVAGRYRVASCQKPFRVGKHAAQRHNMAR